MVLPSVIRQGLYLHLNKKDHLGLTPEERGLKLELTDMINKLHNITMLPLIPDIAIHYRCSDNLNSKFHFMWEMVS